MYHVPYPVPQSSQEGLLLQARGAHLTCFEPEQYGDRSFTSVIENAGGLRNENSISLALGFDETKQKHHEKQVMRQALRHTDQDMAEVGNDGVDVSLEGRTQ